MLLKTTRTIFSSGGFAEGYPSDEAQKAMCCFVYNNIFEQRNKKRCGCSFSVVASNEADYLDLHRGGILVSRDVELNISSFGSF